MQLQQTSKKTGWHKKWYGFILRSIVYFVTSSYDTWPRERWQPARHVEDSSVPNIAKLENHTGLGRIQHKKRHQLAKWTWGGARNQQRSYVCCLDVVSIWTFWQRTEIHSLRNRLSLLICDFEHPATSHSIQLFCQTLEYIKSQYTGISRCINKERESDQLRTTRSIFLLVETHSLSCRNNLICQKILTETRNKYSVG